MLKSRLTIKHLKMMHAIDVAESTTRAAEMLSISQPALSSRLHDAEEILGVPLFTRRGRRLSMAPAGRRLLNTARSVLKELESVEQELARLPERSTQTLRLGLPQHASFSWLPAAVKTFEARFPSLALEIVPEAASQPRDALSQNDVDVAIVSSPSPRIQIDRRRFQSRRLLRDEFVALLPTRHKKADKRFLIAEDFADETYITNNAVPESNREYELFFQPSSIYPERVVQVGFTSAILELVAAGIGTTIITRWILASDRRVSGVVSRPLTRTGLYLNWFALFSKTSPMSAETQLLCDLIEASGDTAI